jgi:hypothetical protein
MATPKLGAYRAMTGRRQDADMKETGRRVGGA